MKITLEISDIDYGAFVSFLLPKLRNRLENSDGVIPKLLYKIAGMPPEAAGKMFNMLPQKTKNGIVVYLINNSKDKLVDAAEEYGRDKGLNFTINSLGAE